MLRGGWLGCASFVPDCCALSHQHGDAEVVLQYLSTCTTILLLYILLCIVKIILLYMQDKY